MLLLLDASGRAVRRSIGFHAEWIRVNETAGYPADAIGFSWTAAACDDDEPLALTTSSSFDTFPTRTAAGRASLLAR